MITVHWMIVAAVVFVAFLGGMWLGRGVRQMVRETEQGERGGYSGGGNEIEMEQSRSGEEDRPLRGKSAGVKRILMGRQLGSPVSGEVSPCYEKGRRGATIKPEEGILYSPESGKITRLYPMGNAMLLQTDYGMEVLLQVGNRVDELYSNYYRARVVQNEIVNRGKVLLEFDLEGLWAEGQEPYVTVSVEGNYEPEDIQLTDRERIRVGEELIRVRTGGAGGIPPERRDRADGIL